MGSLGRDLLCLGQVRPLDHDYHNYYTDVCLDAGAADDECSGGFKQDDPK